jgi:hypothetical protein
LIALLFWFIAWVLLEPSLGASLDVSAGVSLSERASAGKRPAIWRLGLDAIAAKPWLGWGWNQGAAAHVALVAREPSIQILIPFFHNLVIDLLLWNGIPVGALVVAGGAAWFVLRWRDARNGESRLLLLALGTLLVHAMLELPHGYAYFLLPAGLMMGMVDAQSMAPTRLTVPRGAVGAAVILLAVALASLAHDYQAVEEDFLAMRMRAARVPNQPPLAAAPRAAWLTPLTEVLAALRIRPAREMSDVDLALLHRAAYRYPSIGNLLRLAHADTLNARPHEACQALLLLCQMQPAVQCQLASAEWRRLSAGPDAAAFATVAFPDGQCSTP